MQIKPRGLILVVLFFVLQHSINEVFESQSLFNVQRTQHAIYNWK